MTTPHGPKAVTELKKGCQDAMFKRHCAWITLSLMLGLTLVIIMGADGSIISGLISPATLYGQELTDAIKRISRK
jgi:hypothetical protein